jgi:hypothetical protein
MPKKKDATANERQLRWVQRNYTKRRLDLWVNRLFARQRRDVTLAGLFDRLEDDLTNLLSVEGSTTEPEEEPASQEQQAPKSGQ